MISDGLTYVPWSVSWRMRESSARASFSLSKVRVICWRLPSRQYGDELFDVLGRRWALRLVWEMGDTPLTYRELASRVPDMSTSVLTQRLRELRSARLVEHAHGYRLTPTGRELRAQLGSMPDWAERVGFAEDA